MITALSLASVYEAGVYMGAVRALTGIVAIEIAFRALQQGAKIASKGCNDSRKWVKLGTHVVGAAFMGTCTFYNKPTVAVMGALFYTIYSIGYGAKQDAYKTASLIRYPFVWIYTHLPPCLASRLPGQTV